MTTRAAYRINQPAVISEVIDGEAIIVNLDSGAYYSLRDSACTIWNLLLQEQALPDVAAAIASQYNGAPAVIETGIQDLVATLLAEQLIVPTAPAADPSPLPALPADHRNGSRPQFQQPVLEKFTDMADLLLLDPIHEVDELGWPHAAAPRQATPV